MFILKQKSLAGLIAVVVVAVAVDDGNCIMSPIHTTESGSVSYRRYCLPPLLADLELANHLDICKFLYLCKCMSFTLRPSREPEGILHKTHVSCMHHAYFHGSYKF